MKILTVVLLCVALIPLIAPAQDVEPPALERVFSDDFSTDTRADYEIDGDVTWEQGKLTLAEGASIGRAVNGGAWAEVELALELPKLSKAHPQSELRVWLILDRATNCYVRLRRTLSDSGPVGSVALVDTGEQDGKAIERVVRQTNLQDYYVERLSVEYRNGMVRVMADDEALLAYIKNGSANVVATRSEARSIVTLDMLAAMALSQEVIELSDDQKQQLAEAKNANHEMIRLYRGGKFAEAAEIGEQELLIRKAILGERHTSYATSLNNLAALCRNMGDYARAGPLFKQALEIQRSVLGENHPDYARSLGNLAALYGHSADYAQAEPLYKQSIEIRKSVLGEKNPDYAVSLNSLAALYMIMGDYARAEPLFKQALEVQKSVVGERHRNYVLSLHSLAILYRSMGDYARALPLSKQAVKIRKVALGENHPSYANSLNNLAGLYEKLGDYTQAESLHKQALEITKIALGEEHPNHAANLNNLARLYRNIGDYGRAEQHHQQALRIIKSALGEQHPNYVASMNNLALLHGSMGNYGRAAPLYKQALQIGKSVLGEKHPNYANSLHNLAFLYMSMGDYAGAEPLVDRAADIVQQNLDDSSLVQSERQQKRNQSERRTVLDGRLGIALRAEAPASEVLQDMWRWKGAVTFRQRAYRRVAANPKLAPIFESLQSVSRQLSAISDQAPVPPPSAAPKVSHDTYQQKRDMWEQRFASLNLTRENLEQQIAADSSEFRKFREPLTVAAVQQLLPANTAYVDFLDYEHATPDPKQKGKTNYERRYIAFVVRPDREPAMIGLGAVDSLSAANTAFRHRFVGGQNTESDGPKKSAAAAQLRTLLWNPIEKHLDGIQTVVISPDTVLGTLPLAALPGRKPDSFLIEDYALVRLPMANLLPGLFGAQSNVPNAGLLVVGDIDYNSQSEVDEIATENPVLLAINYDRGQLAATRGGNARHWESLPGFRAELESVAALHQSSFGSDVPVVTLSNAEATKTLFLKSAKQARTLHVITHGYFERPSVKSIDQVVVKTGSTGNGHDPFINSWMPGLLSGLVMAGANYSSQDRDVPRDGILRAAEIEAASMVGVDLVVLSACETGLGPVAGGEGLTGLQRAFQIAGARSVIASLWKVDDRATQELMRRFYTNLWLREMSKVDALRDAQLWMLNNPDELAALGVQDPMTRGSVRKRKPTAPNERPDGRTTPYFWAAFSLSGDWR